ncbi:MAG: ribosylnicotinamide kinase [Chrysothrix sp. TS-e1954]|nr:MAG: ribosylnicotinamide kinase [Chrysothrix sp. TS-e1954]
MQDQSVFLVGVSGVSSSGKTTLARLLRDTWPNTVILHEDDFYKPISELPLKEGLVDYDCLESVDQDQLAEAVQYIKSHAALPPTLDSREDQNTVGEVQVDQAVVAEWREKALQISSKAHNKAPLFLVDGFLLYSQRMRDVWQTFDLKLFLRTSFGTAKARREARSGYVTIEGFWEDPPEYVDIVVWPNYAKEHAFLFHYGDVEGPYDLVACEAIGVKPVPVDAENDMTACFDWACKMLAQLYKS